MKMEERHKGKSFKSGEQNTERKTKEQTRFGAGAKKERQKRRDQNVQRERVLKGRV